ncbi:MAG TPA: prolipoprotein diacylglyceryl transferase [Acidimicrobiia bacterium]|jgi:prolipoprotein diacylglyceryl transferase|nr:prolipoprotein diacylglyceryl transferase [Acidimicrobiia bacterium]
MMTAYIPSPAKGILHLGPIPLHAYGLCLAIGVLVAASVAERRWEAKGGRPGVIGEIGVAVVISGVIGARVYHLFTGYNWDQGGIAGTLKIWQGGLSIWGAVGGGVIALLVEAHRKHLAKGMLLDAVAPGVVLAQAIGRWGNYFNQELFGRPTKLPWGLEIDVAHRPAQYLAYKTFQPTFLYESLWCLAVFGVLMWLEHRFRTRPGQTFALYVALYTFGRFFFELMRSDPATRVLGVRFNALLSAALCVIATVWFVALARRATSVEPSIAMSDEDHTVDEPDLGAPAS